MLCTSTPCSVCIRGSAVELSVHLFKLGWCCFLLQANQDISGYGGVPTSVGSRALPCPTRMMHTVRLKKENSLRNPHKLPRMMHTSRGSQTMAVICLTNIHKSDLPIVRARLRTGFCILRRSALTCADVCCMHANVCIATEGGSVWTGPHLLPPSPAPPPQPSGKCSGHSNEKSCTSQSSEGR